MYKLLKDPSELGGFDTVIDVRSPSEFAEDHAPAAISLPVLSDAERARVGTVYVQESKFEARRLGAALVARNVADHLEAALKDKPGGWRPLLYCWRGGQRSQSMAVILSQIGWRTTVLKGGYQTYRRAVVAGLYERPLPHRLIKLDGPTGVGKTDMLARLTERGAQVLDLEALANHRGSLFGELGEQPSQKGFESRLHAALQALDPARPVLVEAESSRIGERFLPSSLWAAMEAAPAIELDAPVQARADALARLYRPQVQDLDLLLDRLARVPGVHHGKARRAGWAELARAGDLEALAAELVVQHYDPAYARSRGDAAPFARLPLTNLGADAQVRAADRILQLIADAPAPAPAR